ncbi:N-6 DNA methylase [Halobellus sp. GM3]|uniref:N-6 DNA methylase n=1 Tax=Halobellus sp. GM3 TaxID=3458410 RepID=UPI00403D6E6C
MSAKEAKFHGIFYTRLLDYIEENDTLFEEPVSEKTTKDGFADIYIPSPLNGEVVIEVKRDDIYPRDHNVVKQARGYADELDTEFFITCNSNDMFLFHYQGEIEMQDVDFYYFNLREADLSEAIPQLLGVVEHVHHEQSLPDQTERERIVGVLRSFHSSIWPTYAALAEKKHGRNERFTQQFDKWVAENDYSDLDEDEQFEVAGKQYAYLLTNKVLFYEVVREKTRPKYDPERGETIPEIETKSGFELDSLHEHTTLSGLEKHLQNQFETIVEEIDYEPIFDSGASLFADFPQNKKTLQTLEDFLNNIEAEEIVSLDEDLLGEIYEELIPAEERKELGQFYTPPKIAETLTYWAIQPREDNQLPKVLDPASGSGTFCVEAYYRLNSVAPTATHQEIVDSIVGADVNRFPLHLTAINLASQNISERTDRLHLYHDSFFNIEPETQYLASTRIGEQEEVDGVLGKFDAAVANPPYMDHRSLYPDSEHFRSHLKELGKEYYDGDKRLSGYSDAYVYFVTHGTQFLRDGGRMGYIIPTKWMMTRYGEGFQQFLFDQFKVRAVVGFGARAFEDAFVDGAMLMLEKCNDESERRNNTVNFIRLKDTMEVEDIIDTLDFDYPIEDNREMAVVNREAYRTVAVSQDYLMDRETNKLGYFLDAPQTFIEMLENPMMVPLDDLLADSGGGVKTGANEFFYLDKKDAAERGIDEQFLSPAVRWIKDIEQGQVLNEKMTNLRLLDVHEYVEDVKSQGGFEQSDLEERVKQSLREDGHTELVDYIREGEARGFNERKTTASRDVWFDVGQSYNIERKRNAAILHPKGFKYRIFASRNEGIVPNNRLHCLYPDAGVDTMALLGVLNSNVYQGLVEAWGRSEGRGMLELAKYELISVPVLDIRKLETEELETIKDAYQALEADETDAQDRLDEAVIKASGVDISVKKLQKLREAVTERRNNRGTTSEVMVEKVDTLEELGTSTFTVGSSETEAELSDFM